MADRSAAEQAPGEKGDGLTPANRRGSFPAAGRPLFPAITEPRGPGRAAMRYQVMTEVPPEEVLERAKRFYADHTRMELEEESGDEVAFRGEIGRARLRVDRHHNRTNVHAETDRVVGLDVTDVTKRFLYTLERA